MSEEPDPIMEAAIAMARRFEGALRPLLTHELALAIELHKSQLSEDEKKAYDNSETGHVLLENHAAIVARGLAGLVSHAVRLITKSVASRYILDHACSKCPGVEGCSVHERLVVDAARNCMEMSAPLTPPEEHDEPRPDPNGPAAIFIPGVPTSRAMQIAEVIMRAIEAEEEKDEKRPGTV